MANLQSYEGICSSLDNLVEETDIKNAQNLIKEIRGIVSSKIISKKLGLSAAEKDSILTVHLPLVEEQIQAKAKEAKKPKSKREQKKEAFSTTGYNYNFYDEDDPDDKSEDLPTWESINPDELIYPEWLHLEGLPRFFALDDILYKAAACVCLIHSAAIPGTQRNVITQAELPKVLCYGKPLSGKSTFCNWVGNHYYLDSDENYSAFQTVVDNDSYKGLRDVIDRACNIGDGILREACVHIDDFEPRHILPGGIWGKSKGIFITVTRSQTTSRVSTNGAKEDTQSVFYNWALTLLSMNNHPNELFSQLPKMERRCLLLPFNGFGSESLGEYSWHNLRDEYLKIWNKQSIEREFWRGCLRPLLRKPFKDFKLQPEFIPRSLVLIATGIFTGIFKNESEAEEYFSQYWEFVESKKNEGSQDLFLDSLDAFVNERESQGETLVSRLGRQRRYIEISMTEIIDKVGSVSALSPKDKEVRVIGFMRMKGYTPHTRPTSQGHYQSFFVKNLD